jgi:hypothetical protein
MLLIARIALLCLLATTFAAEDRPYMKRIDAAPATPDDGRLAGVMTAPLVSAHMLHVRESEVRTAAGSTETK